MSLGPANNFFNIFQTNDFCQLKIAGKCSQKAGNAILVTPDLKISRTPPPPLESRASRARDVPPLPNTFTGNPFMALR